MRRRDFVSGLTFAAAAGAGGWPAGELLKSEGFTAGLIKSGPQKIIAQGTDWRFINELKKELKG